MRRVIYSLGTSVDGYAMDSNGSIEWSNPDPEVFRSSIEEIRSVDVHLMGRRLYETMLYWETADLNPEVGDDERTWIDLWKPLPKVVFSTTLDRVEGNARLASGDLADEIAQLRAEPGDGDIAIGGPALAAQAIDLGLVDEFRVRVYPLFLGGGVPFFPRHEQRTDLEVVSTRAFDSGVTLLRYRVIR